MSNLTSKSYCKLVTKDLVKKYHALTITQIFRIVSKDLYILPDQAGALCLSELAEVTQVESCWVFAAWNYYPAVTEDREAAAKLPPRLHAHADMDVLTILYQREGNPFGIHPKFSKNCVNNLGNTWERIIQLQQLLNF